MSETQVVSRLDARPKSDDDCPPRLLGLRSLGSAGTDIRLRSRPRHPKGKGRATCFDARSGASESRGIYTRVPQRRISARQSQVLPSADDLALGLRHRSPAKGRMLRQSTNLGTPLPRLRLPEHRSEQCPSIWRSRGRFAELLGYLRRHGSSSLRLHNFRDIPSQSEQLGGVERSINGGQIHQATGVKMLLNTPHRFEVARINPRHVEVLNRLFPQSRSWIRVTTPPCVKNYATCCYTRYRGGVSLIMRYATEVRIAGPPGGSSTLPRA